MRLVRGDRSGVFYGEIEKIDGREVTFKTCRRIWYWDGAASISQLSITGTSNPDDCKFSVRTKNHIVLDAIEILHMEDAAIKSLNSVKDWVV
jgi:hypothetical protein